MGIFDFFKKENRADNTEALSDNNNVPESIGEVRGNGENYTKDEYGKFNGSTSGGSAKQENDSEKALDKSEENGIMIIGSEQYMNALTRKEKSDTYLEPMPKKQLQRIVKAFKSKGGTIQMDDITDEYLKSKHAEAITYDSKTILLKNNPSRASVFEELIHSAQYRKGENDGSYKSRLICEIAAQKKLLKNSKAYKLTKAEIEQTQSALLVYEQELNNHLKNGGA